MKNITFCADDYGQNPTISQAIIDLLQKKRISATSCLVTSTSWKELAPQLEPFEDDAQIGLHFNLTEGVPLSPEFSDVYPKFLSLTQMLKCSFLRQISLKLIECELNAQLSEFVDKRGCLPNFIDGHQHIHHFPVVREALINVYNQRLRGHGAYIRCVHDKEILGKIFHTSFFKKAIIEFSGANVLKKRLINEKIPHNTSFAGVYDFKNAKFYADYCSQFLAQIHDGGIIMCHPGLNSTDSNDAIAQARWLEYQFFQSDQFDNLCHAHGVVLSPLALK